MAKFPFLKKTDAILIFVIFLCPFLFGRVSHHIAPTAQAQPSQAPMLTSFETYPSWTIQETFTVDINILEAEDICAWQVKLLYDPNSLVILNVATADFIPPDTMIINPAEGVSTNAVEEGMNNGQAILCYLTNYYKDTWSTVTAQTLIGGTSFDLTTLSGSGKVATVTFGVWSHAENFDVLMEDPMLLNINHAPTTLGSVIVNQNS